MKCEHCFTNLSGYVFGVFLLLFAGIYNSASCLVGLFIDREAVVDLVEEVKDIVLK